MALILKPSYKAIVNFLTNIDVVEELLKTYISQKTAFKYSNLNPEIRENILNHINDNQSHHLSNEASLSYLNNILEKRAIRHPFYNLLDFLSTEHFEFIRGRNILKVENIELFQYLYNHIDINPIFAMAITKSIQDLSENSKFSYIKYKTDNSSITYPQRFSFLEHFSDNHFHLGGANSFAYRLHSILQDPLNVDTSNLPQNKELLFFNKNINIRIIVYATHMLEKMIFSFILRNTSKYKRNSDFDYKVVFQQQFLQLAKGILSRNLKDIQQVEELKIEFNKTKLINKIIKIPPLIDIRTKIQNQNISFYVEDDYYNNLIYKIILNNGRKHLLKSDKILWILFSEILKKHRSETLKDAIYIYTVFRNVIHSYIIQQQKEGGLSYFSSYSRSSLRRAKKITEFSETFKSILSPNFKINIEGRINFQDRPSEYAKEMEKWLKAFFIVGSEQTKKCTEADNLTFLFHFKKKLEKIDEKLKKENPYYTLARHKKLRLELFQQAKAFLNFMKSPKYYRYNILLTKNDFRDRHFLIDFDCVEEKNRDYGYKLLTESEKDILINKKYIFRHDGIINKKCQNGRAIQYEVDLRKFVSGIDASSKEENTPPEVFAPIYNFIRNSIELSHIPFEHHISKKSSNSCNNKLFQFSYHVGEEFKDILSGIRHIFETVIFLGFRKGDRLGHALALGLNPEQFVLKNRVIISSVEEQFDNAIFGYFILDKFSEDSRLKNIYYQKAMKYGARIYKDDYTIDNYINAWLLRRNSPITLRKFLDNYFKYNTKHTQKAIENIKFLIKEEAEVCAYSSENSNDKKNKYTIHYYNHIHEDNLFFRYSLPDIFKLNIKEDDRVCKRYEWAREDKKAWELFIKYHFYSDIRKRGKEEIDVLSTEAENIELIQDIVMEEIIAKRDIVIEVMPTSNVLNSIIESYKEHPMFRFKPVENLNEFNNFGVRKTPLRVIINTDNPGFQATSYINELFLISQAGLKRGYSNEKMEKYLEEIITLGNMLYSGKASQE